jgi:hypothetical protein
MEGKPTCINLFGWQNPFADGLVVAYPPAFSVIPSLVLRAGTRPQGEIMLFAPILIRLHQFLHGIVFPAPVFFHDRKLQIPRMALRHARHENVTRAQHFPAFLSIGHLFT